MYKDGDIVKHTFNENIIGVVHTNSSKVRWFYLDTSRETGMSDLDICGHYITPYTEEIPLKIQQQIEKLYGKPLTQEERIIRKIKELDTKWELKMKAKATSSPINPAQDVRAETTLLPTQMDTATALDAYYTSRIRQLYHLSDEQIRDRLRGYRDRLNY